MTPRRLIALWGLLLALLGVSLALGYLGNVVLSTVLIFSVAALKAFLVAAFYMRLKWEPGYVVAILLFGLSVILIFLFALVPDIVFVHG